MPIFRPSLAILFFFLAPFFPASADSDLKLQKNLTVHSGNENTPLFVEADLMQGYQDQGFEASGNVEVRKIDQIITADWLNYLKAMDEIQADGHVRVEQKGGIMMGPKLRLHLQDNTGFMDMPVYWLPENGARGEANLLTFEGKEKYKLQKAIYTTCATGNNDWFLKIDDLEIDRKEQVGIAHDASIRFKDVPILYSPWLDFPLSGQRRSGFLAPIFGSTVTGGSEITIPYYWNIAPNMDATFSPRIMSKRGQMLDTEFRYLEPSFKGESHFNILPNDQITRAQRSELVLKHEQQFTDEISGGINFQKVSDDNFYRDLSSTVAATSQTNLPQEGFLSYTNAGWNLTSKYQRFQTLQDPLAPIIPPYFRTPQILLTGSQPDVLGANVAFAGEFVDFTHPTLVNGKRLVLNPSASYPMTNEFGFLTPKIGLHSTTYNLGSNNVTAIPNASSTIPIFNLDSGLFFEKENAFNSFSQTLEPRIYYVYIPYKNQNNLPNFDSAPATFSFAQLFTENQFVGNDRISDANNITTALTSRFIEDASGIERLRLSLGQRIYLSPPRLIPVTASKSDWIASIGGKITPSFRLNTDFEYDPNHSLTNQINFNAHYQPETGKVLNFAYLMSRGAFSQFTQPAQGGPLYISPIEQFDLSSQWPLYKRWNAVARWNYSLFDKQLLDAVAGVEYDADCWALRLVSRRFATGTQQMSSAIFVQLELNGMTKVGSDPLDALRKSIPGYVKPNSIREGSLN